MGKNEFRRVSSGEPLIIPAQTYNAMLDAAEAHRNRKITLSPQNRGFDSLFVHVANDTNRELYKFDVVGLDSPMPTGDTGNIIFSGVIPKKKHKGKFAILQSDASPGEVVRACVHGVTFARLKHDGEKEPTSCDIIEGDTQFLKSNGNTEVLWSEADANPRWAIIRIGGGGMSLVFPIKLKKTGGEDGTDEKKTSWTYSVTHATTDEELGEEIDPTASPHQWKRPSIGKMTPATFGYAHYNTDEKLVIGWINETFVLGTCK